jgi:hypothetical protein
MVIESVMSQYCRFNSAGGMVLYHTFREPRWVEAQECRATKAMSKMTVGGKKFRVTSGTTLPHYHTFSNSINTYVVKQMSSVTINCLYALPFYPRVDGFTSGVEVQPAWGQGVWEVNYIPV